MEISCRCSMILLRDRETIFYLPIIAFNITRFISVIILSGRIVQSVTCLATDASLTADPWVASSIPAWSHTFVGIDYEIISMVILLASAESFKNDCCQLQAEVCT